MEKPKLPVAISVLEVASDTLGVPEDALPPLTRVLDPDALEALVSPRGELQRSDVQITFKYAGLDVVVQSGPTVYACPIGEAWDGSVQKRPYEV